MTEYSEILYNLYTNKKLNQEGLSDYVKILRQEIIELKEKVIDLEYQLRGAKNV